MKDLFDDLDLDGLVSKPTPPLQPKAETKKEVSVPKKETKPEVTKAKVEEVTELAKEVVKDLTPVIESSLDDVFGAGAMPNIEAPKTDYIKEELIKTLKEKHEVEFRDITVTIDTNEDNSYSVFKVETKEPDEDSEDGEEEVIEELVPIEENLPNIDVAVEKAVAYLFKETKYNPNDKSAKGGKKGKKTSTSAPKKEEPPYEGPRTVKVWGRELFVETDPKVTNEQIKEKIARDYGMPEFKEGEALFYLDKTTGILSVGLSFNKRG